MTAAPAPADVPTPAAGTPSPFADAPIAAPPPPPPPPPAAARGRAAARKPAEDLARIVFRQWRVAALVAAAVTLLAWLAAAVQPKRYRATAIGAVTPITDNLSASDVIRGVDTLERRVIVASLAALAAAPVTQRLTNAGGDYTIVAAVMPNTNLFRIEVEGGDARRVAEIANLVPTALNAQARAMYKMYGVTRISEATPPKKPSLPRVGRALAAGLVLGTMLGIAAAWVLDRRRLV